MEVDGSKIKRLISAYGSSKEYPEKSYIAMFCKDFDLNYNQWNAYTRGAQVVGAKIILKLMEVFPDVNLNWLLKDDSNMFISKEYGMILTEPGTTYQKTSKNITNEDLMRKLDELEIEIKKMNTKN